MAKSPKVTTDLEIDVDAVHAPADLEGFDYLRDLGFPGAYPFTRGIYPEMSRHQPWRYALFTGFDSPEKTNERWKFLYKAGQRSFNIVYDLPTHMGLDSDDPMAEDETGRLGIPIDTVRDWEALWADLPMDMHFNSNIETGAAIIMAIHIATAERRGLSPDKLRGSISNDPLCTAVSKGTTIFPIKHGVRLATDLIEYGVRNMPKFYPVNLKGVNLSEGGSSMAQEIGFVFSNALCLLDESLRRGLDVDEVASKFSFFCSNSHHLFEETAKYRAARRLWAKLMKEEYGATKPASMMFRFTAMANPLYLYPEEPELNLVRGALAVLAGALGGAQGMPNPGYDEAYAIPTEKSQRLALGTMQIIAEESNITKTVDPLGGSYYMEVLTNKMEEKIREKMEAVNRLGGAIKAIERGFMQQDILDYFCKIQDQIASGQRVVVRKNKYRVEDDIPVEERIALHSTDKDEVSRHIRSLRKVKAERDNGRVAECLRKLRAAAVTDENLMPGLIDAAKANASVGEMAGALKEAWGAYKETLVI
ncbi:MAG: methylmalonyl-CoA mutase [Chloroflexi bacterium]|nr:methylmalonyl-CoA mutase [Chloroflexota bacterium]